MKKLFSGRVGKGPRHERSYAAVSALVGWVARLRLPSFVLQPFLRRFVQSFEVDLGLIDRPLESFVSVDDFFTRDLRPGVRPIDGRANAVLSPADGRVHNFGFIEDGVLLQAKGIPYSLEALLTDPLEAERFRGGSYLTVYLSPRDCHHVFAPMAGSLRRAVHVPGRLFPVREPIVSTVQGLYTRNERVVTLLDAGDHQLAVVLVAATNVGNITLLPEARLGAPRPYLTNRGLSPAVGVAAGQKLGTFHLGSTVVLVFSKPVTWREGLLGASVCYGEALGSWG